MVAAQPNCAACATARRPQRQAARVVTQQRLDGVGPVADVVPVDEHAGVTDRGGQAADVGGHDRGAARLGLDGDEAEGLASGRARATRSAARYHCASTGRSTGGTKRTTSSMPSARGELLELVRAGEAAAARAAEDGDREARRRSRVAAQQLRRDPEQHVGGLERLDATDEEEQLAVDGQAERAPRPRPGRRG